MPRRRTQDVVHAVMTDHFIQRKPAEDLLAPLPERTESSTYKGPVVPYYPTAIPAGDPREVYVAVAQVKQFTNLDRGIPQLREALARHAPGSTEPYFELAKAYTEIGQMHEAKQFYQQALARDAGYRPAVSGLAKAFARSGEFAKAADLLESVVHKGGGDATVLNDLGLIYVA
jgi:hypothetical protein